MFPDVPRDSIMLLRSEHSLNHVIDTLVSQQEKNKPLSSLDSPCIREYAGQQRASAEDESSCTLE